MTEYALKITGSGEVRDKDGNLLSFEGMYGQVRDSEGKLLNNEDDEQETDE